MLILIQKLDKLCIGHLFRASQEFHILQVNYKPDTKRLQQTSYQLDICMKQQSTQMDLSAVVKIIPSSLTLK